MKALYSRFLAASPGRLHFAAHSHHPWPDVTRDAQIEVWDDAARFADHKWDHIFQTVVPEAQGHIARILDLPAAEQIVFAPNTHEFVVRLLSCFPPGQRIKVVTTDSEFHSFSRQIARFEEDGLADVTRVPVEPFATFSSRFAQASEAAAGGLVFLSHVFFNSGFVVRDLETIVEAAPKTAMVVVDGYHSFLAVPTSLRPIADRAFFLAGGYKYAQSGEGACFLAVPRGSTLRPLNTGWFAGFGSLEDEGGGRVGFASDGSRFMGATFDPSGLYRFNAVARLLETHGMTIESIDAQVKDLQGLFLSGLENRGMSSPVASELIAPDAGIHGLGHFLTFRRKDAGAIAARLLEAGVIVDHRGDRLRFGFGVYQDAGDVEALLSLL